MDAKGRVPWQPLLEGDDAVAAQGVIDDIAAALALDAVIPSQPYLSGGSAGRALFYGYLSEVWPDRHFDTLAMTHLERAIDQTAELSMRAGLYSGFTGIAWVTEHLQAGLIDDDDDPNLAVDELLCDYLATTPWPDDYDVISGLAGCGIYGLERMPRATGREILTRVVERLHELAVRDGAGTSWHRKPEFLLPEGRVRSPDGFYDLGTAHGVPGVLAVLAGALAAGVAEQLARPLLEGAWQWMMANRLPAGAETTYAYSISERPPVPARSAWCYGDPGVACAMYSAARRLEDPAWIADALVIARRAAVRPMDRCGCMDAGLCHGTAGLALLYNRLWHETGETIFADAARRWYQQTIERRQPGRGVAGFQAYYPGAGTGPSTDWVDDRSFLTGAEGIGLALLAAISTVEPAWDRLLLASLRPSRKRR
jgi:class I lanthipeptide synthase